MTPQIYLFIYLFIYFLPAFFNLHFENRHKSATHLFFKAVFEQTSSYGNIKTLCSKL